MRSSVRHAAGAGFVLEHEVKPISGIFIGLTAVVGGLLLASCTTWKPIVLPSGQDGYTVDCSGSNLSWSHCYRKAGHACPRGYDIVQRVDTRGGHPVVGDLFGVMGGSVVDRGMLIRCRDDGSVVPSSAAARAATPAARVAAPVAPPASQPSTGAETFPIGEGFHPNAQPPASGRQ